MNKIEALIKGVKGKSYKAGPPDKAGQQYRQWVEELYKDSIADADRFLVTYAEHLREYHVALTINANTTMKTARKRLQTYFDSLDQQKFLDIDRKLKSLFQRAMDMLDKYVEEHGEPENPLLMQLKELLLSEGEEKSEQDKAKKDQSQKVIEDGRNECEDKQDADTDSSDGSPEKQDGNSDAKNDSDGDHDRKEVSQEENGKEEKNLENEEEANEQEIIGNEDGNENSKRDLLSEEKEDAQQNGASNDYDLVKGDITCNGGAYKADDGTDEVEKSEVKKETDRGELDNASSSADSVQEGDENRGRKEWKGPKGILFTRTRESTDALLDWIKETEELNSVLRPEPLVGSGDGNSK